MFKRKAFFTVLAALLGASPLFGQEVYLGASAFGGALFPTSDLVAADLSQKTGFVFGGRLSLWTLRRFAVELEGAYALSDLDTYRGDQSGSVAAFSMSLLYSIIKPPLEPLEIYLGGGLGFVRRSADFFEQEDEIRELTDVAAVVGAGISYGVARNLYIRMDLRDYLSSYKQPYERSQLQNDLLITAAIEVRPRIMSPRR